MDIADPRGTGRDTMSNSATEWYNENEGRSYPLSETSTQLSDNNLLLPCDLLADLSILMPFSVQANNVYLSSLRTAGNSISLGISAGPDGLLAGCYLLTDLEPYRAFPLVSVQDNVQGWVVFGNGISRRNTTTTYYRFSTAQQSQLDGRSMHYMEPPTITRFYRRGSPQDQAVEGIVSLAAGAGVMIRSSTVNGLPAITVGLDDTMRKVLAPACMDAASEKTCGLPPIRTINGVGPDLNGTIHIRFE